MRTPPQTRCPDRAVLAMLLLAALGLGVVAFLTWLRPVEPEAPSPSSAGSTSPSGRVVRPEAYGARGDARTDDTTALRAALASMRPGDRLTLSPGRTYRHTDILRVTVPHTTLTGPGRLLATNETRSSVWVDADHTTLADLTLDATPATARYVAYEQHRLRIKDVTDTTLTRVKVTRSAAAGIYVEGANRFTLTDVTVTDTKADGIHLTGGATHGTLTRPTVTRPGDDGIAVVSYDDGAPPVTDITVATPTVTDQSWGRAYSVVGGSHITLTDITATRSAGAALYIAREGAPWNTQPVTDVRVTRGRIDQANVNPAIGHGAVLLYTARPGPSLTDITITGLTITRTTGHSGRITGALCDTGTITRAHLSDITYDTTRLTPFYTTCPRTSVQRTNWHRR